MLASSSHIRQMDPLVLSHRHHSFNYRPSIS